MLIREARRRGSLGWLSVLSLCAVAACARPVPRSPAQVVTPPSQARWFRPAAPASPPPSMPAPFVEPMAAGTSGFSIRYSPTTNPEHAQLRAELERSRVLERVASMLNHTVHMPVGVQIQTVDCSMTNAFYDERTRRITVCYELLDHFLDEFRRIAKNPHQLDDAVVGATLFTFYHEAAHGMIQLLDLPAVGREEDAADQLATLSLLAMGDTGAQMAIASAYWFQLQAKSKRHVTPFWDEHAFDAQRFYNILCLIYGSNPSKYGYLVTNGSLPMPRAGRCTEEYGKISHAWNRLLAPYYAHSAPAQYARRGTRTSMRYGGRSWAR